MTASVEILSGFTDPVFESQTVFRRLLDAMSFPGRSQRLLDDLVPPEGLDAAQAAIALALVDRDTPIWLDAAADTSAARAFLRFHCGCRIVDGPGEARFALVGDAERMPPLDMFDAGTDLYPDASATLLVRVSALTGGERLTLSGPGIATTAEIAPVGLPPGFPAQWAGNHAIYPTGVDLVLTCGPSAVAIPRSVSMEG